MEDENSEKKFWTCERKVTNGGPGPRLEAKIKNQTLSRKLKSRGLGRFLHLVRFNDRSLMKILFMENLRG